MLSVHNHEDFLPFVIFLLVILLNIKLTFDKSLQYLEDDEKYHVGACTSPLVDGSQPLSKSSAL